MSHPNPSTALAETVVDELVRQGVRFLVICPGSRSTALAIAAAQSSELDSVVALDERSAAFQALGSSRAGGLAAVLSTSGTATANFFPAVVEAHMSGVPLVVLTADRPAELRGVGANQTIDQVNLYGTKVRRFVHIEAPDETTDLNQHWRTEVARSVHLAVGAMPGPVHINLAFREPTVPVSNDGRVKTPEYPFPTPPVDVDLEPIDRAQQILPDIQAGKGLIVAGDGDYDRRSLANVASEKGWPILATALSSMRGGQVITSYHHLLARGIPDNLRPDVVVAVGAVGPSQRLEGLADSASQRVRIDAWGRNIDPRRTATSVVQGDVVSLLATAEDSPAGWGSEWLAADGEMRQRLSSALEDAGLTGGGAASALSGAAIGALVAASSLPIREVDAHFNSDAPVYGNRGASGIDGFVSTAIGVARHRERTVALSGDLSLLHDSNGFLTEALPDLTIVVLDNDGGGLFDSLPQARHAPDYERLFVTPQRRDLRELVSFHRLRFVEVEDLAQLRQEVASDLSTPGVTVIRVPIDRKHDLVVRQSLGM